MDEAMNSLDNSLKINVLNFLDKYLEKTNTGLIYVTHDEKELPYITSRNYRLTGGMLYDAQKQFCKK
jgi:ABC-type molybdenum transport system ATPase subunit/photorepair protein PhrA